MKYRDHNKLVTRGRFLVTVVPEHSNAVSLMLVVLDGLRRSHRLTALPPRGEMGYVESL